jgi:hypothetical protein
MPLNQLEIQKSQKKPFQRQLANFGVEDLQFGLRELASGILVEGRDHILHGLQPPLRDLNRMHVKLLSQLRQCLLATQGNQRHLGLDLPRMAPSRLSHRHLHRRQSAPRTDDLYH